MAIGETPGAQWRPAIEWLANTRHASNWYLIGSDYVWPWLSHKAIKKYIADAGGRVVGEEFVPIGEHNHSTQLARIQAAKPDEKIRFSHGFGNARTKWRRCCPS